MMGSQINIRKEDVIQKLKDDGDFDRLRLLIIRKLRDKEELRKSIISMVKQSEELNRAGNENLKPRQFCDAIYKEIQTEAMKHISDSLWEIIRSDDGKSEITKTVQSVYDKLLNPKGNEEGNSSSPNILAQFQNGTGNNSIQKASASEINDPMSDNELNEPPGFSVSDTHQSNSHGEQKGEEQQQRMPSERGPTEEHKEESNHPLEVLEPHDVDHGVPPGFSAAMENRQPCDGSDEDPDVPPGFG